MKYDQITEARFLERPNRFLARVALGTGQEERVETVHVKNTGRCQELFVPGAAVLLSAGTSPGRRTAYDLVAVYKKERLVNVDSQAPNAVVREWLEKGGLEGVTQICPEWAYRDSRFDFYAQGENRRILIEVKGVTLEHQGVALFPDAPSDRALKHVEELTDAAGEGYECYVLFVIQMKGISCFTPNAGAQPRLAQALRRAQQAGVRILAYDCCVKRDSLALDSPVPVMLEVEKQALCHIAPPLLKWYDKCRRILPWREQVTPYRVWVSEIMLQQTRVEAVKPYFERFMNRLPDVKALAEAPEDELLKLWEGLGYYSRARNLQQAARRILTEYRGQMPTEYEDIRKLKGIGNYTAGAIASIAFGRPVPAVDGNVLRVLARLLEDDGDILSPAVKKRVEEALREVIPKDRPGDFNQALMELGATVCLPNGRPKCEQCPWEPFCLANLHRTQAEYPQKRAKKARTVEQKTVLVLQDTWRAAIQKRPDRGLLAGLYEFPSLEGHASREEVLQWLKERGLHAVRIRPLPASRHIFTHREWHMTGYAILVDELEPMGADRSLLFVRPEETEEKYPIPSAFAAYTKYLHIKTGKERIEGR